MIKTKLKVITLMIAVAIASTTVALMAVMGASSTFAMTPEQTRVIKDTKGSELTQAALFHYNGKNKSDWAAAYELAHNAIRLDNNDLVAHRLLGNMYYQGKGTKVNYDDALYHYEEAAAGDAISAYMVGKMYLSGLGVDLDVVEGAKYVKQAADMGEPVAQYELAQLSLDQSRVEQNPTLKMNLEKSSYHYASQCIKVKMPECIEILGQIVEQGLAGVDASPEKAKSIYQIAQGLK
jgi:TPR repeat protein